MSRSRKFDHVIRRLQRQRGIRDARPRFLLCFEDTVSAPSYFDALRNQLALSEASIVVDRSAEGSDPRSVVERARTLAGRLEDSDELSRVEGDQVWAIVDVDRHETLADARTLARDNAIEMAISNPCFEYWLLLHFEESAPAINDCSELIRDHLRRHIENYSKGGTSFAKIVARADLAAERAYRQFKGKAEPDPAACCPCSTLFRLIQAFPRKEATD